MKGSNAKYLPTRTAKSGIRKNTLSRRSLLSSPASAHFTRIEAAKAKRLRSAHCMEDGKEELQVLGFQCAAQTSDENSESGPKEWDWQARVQARAAGRNVVQGCSGLIEKK